MSDAHTFESDIREIRVEQAARLDDLPIGEHVARLYDSHRLRIYRFLVAQGLEPANAQELAQDVFVRLFLALSKGTRIESEQAWLYGVASKLVADYWRREGRPIWLELDSIRETIEQMPSAQDSPEDDFVSGERLRRVAKEMLRLPKEQRMTLHLRMQGQRYREIAKHLGVSISTIADWLSTASDRLRKVADE